MISTMSSSFLNILLHVLVFLPSIITAQVSTLTTDYYQKTCPDFSKIVLETVTARQKEHSGAASGALRLLFHDCFMEGCDASILIATSDDNKAEREDETNLSLSDGAFETVATIKTALESSCPGVVSCADILAQSARDLVIMLGGPSFEVKLGRKDGLQSHAQSVQGKLPLARQSLPDMFSIFEKNGFTLKEFVALAGAHTIGISHCTQFADRVFGPEVDPELNATLAGELKDKCKDYEKSHKKSVFLDSVTPSKFDNMYFKNLQQGLGVLASDHLLFKDESTRPFVELYAKDEAVFFEDFARAMEKLSMIEVKGGSDGEVRRKCDVFNSVKV